MSNTSNSKCEKGSKFWMQEIANNISLKKQIEMLIGDNLIFLSPLQTEFYKEYQLKEQKIFSDVLGLDEIEFKKKFSFWATNQPHWDAIATSADGKTLYLFEAKAHLKELQSKIRATDEKSVKKITNSMKKVFAEISIGKANFTSWTDKYYQLGNRFTFLQEMNQIKFPKIERTILILLNIVSDRTYISTSQEDWEQHYKEVFLEMTGKIIPPTNAKILYFVGD